MKLGKGTSHTQDRQSVQKGPHPHSFLGKGFCSRTSFLFVLFLLVVVLVFFFNLLVSFCKKTREYAGLLLMSKVHLCSV